MDLDTAVHRQQWIQTHLFTAIMGLVLLLRLSELVQHIFSDEFTVANVSQQKKFLFLII